MRRLLLIALCASIFFVACKKDEKKNVPQQPPVANPQDSTSKPADSNTHNLLVKTLYSDNAFGTDTVHYYYDSMDRCTATVRYRQHIDTATDYYVYQNNLITNTSYRSGKLVYKIDYYINHDLWPDSIYRYQNNSGNLKLMEIEIFQYFGSDSFVITSYQKSGGAPTSIDEYKLDDGNVVFSYSHTPVGTTGGIQSYYTYDQTKLNSIKDRFPTQNLYYTCSKNLPLAGTYSGMVNGQMNYTYTFDSVNRVATRTMTTNGQSLSDTFIY